MGSKEPDCGTRALCYAIKGLTQQRVEQLINKTEWLTDSDIIQVCTKMGYNTMIVTPT